LESGALFALGNALFTASSTIGLRRMSVTESTNALITYQIAFMALLGALLLPFLWVTPGWEDLAIMLAIGLGSGVNQYCWTQAFRFAPAAVASPFAYGAMVWAILLGYLIWGEMPTAALLLGAAIVVASGLYILHREVLLGRARPAEPEPHP
jgi:drug/metabolite transporter (DMT)-like permease